MAAVDSSLRYQNKSFAADQYDDLFEQYIESSPLRNHDSCTGIGGWDGDIFSDTSAAATEIPVTCE